MPSNELPSVCPSITIDFNKSTCPYCGAKFSSFIDGYTCGTRFNIQMLLDQSGKCQISCLTRELTEARDKLAEVEELLNVLPATRTWGTLRNILHSKASVNP